MHVSQFTLILLATSEAISEDCWWSGCQPWSRRQRGCYQHEKYLQTESRLCTRGNKYRCCSRVEDNGGSNIKGQDSALESGICSWYGQSDVPQGQPTASGELFDRHSMHAAHKTLPFGTRIGVMNLKTRKTVNVTINDRGPFIRGRVLDLTYAAFGMIEDRKKGLFKCSYTLY